MRYNTKRQSNIELLRIILSFLVVGWHASIKLFGATSEKTWLFNAMMPLLILPVITFGVISGYFMAEKEDNRFWGALKLVGYFWIFSAIFAIILGATNIVPWKRDSSHMGTDQYALGMILSGGGYWWYAFAWLIISALLPYINAGMNKKHNLSMEITIVVLLFLLTVNNNIWFTLSDTKNNQPADFTRWMSITNYARWTIALLNAHLIGGILFRYGDKMFQKKWLPIYIGILLVFVMLSLLEFKGFFTTTKVFGRRMFMDHCDFFVPIGAICLFAIFKTIPISYNSFINCWARQSFAIYLFQYVFIVIVNHYWNKIVGNIELNYFVSWIIVYLSTLVVSFGITEIHHLYYRYKHQKMKRKSAVNESQIESK